MKIRAIAAAAVAAGALGALPASALASGTPSVTPTMTTPTPTTPATAPTTPSAPVPVAATPAVKGRGTLYLSKFFTINKTAVSVPHRNVAVRAVITTPGAKATYVPGQTVTLEGIQNGRAFTKQTITLKRGVRYTYAPVKVVLRAPSSGVVAVKLTHVTSSALRAFTAERHYQVLDENIAPGAKGLMVDLLQNRLAALHLYLPQSGVYDSFTTLALDTYHRLLGQGEGHTQADAATINDLLNGFGAFHVRFPQQGFHAEGDLSDQVLAYADGAKVKYLLPISSGKPSTPTVLGSYQVYRKQPDFTPDGMYFSNFFTGGYAIHGYVSVPDYPASHGCMRIPDQDAIFAYNLLTIGDWVDVYYT